MDARITLRQCAQEEPQGPQEPQKSQELLPLTENLLRWLQDEPELRGRVSAASAAPRPGQMSGGALETILVSLGSAGVGALARSLPIWLRQQRSKVEIEVSDGSGRSVRVSTDNRKDVEPLIREVLDTALSQE
ncbi:hypothetical protein ACH40E_05955 [Streptomyces acidicola]|uniref:effector-associated constant component EACC1 n=1 Tax=Streptomyces acidicola TaxID=2596892 RepID=UPI00379985D3